MFELWLTSEPVTKHPPSHRVMDFWVLSGQPFGRREEASTTLRVAYLARGHFCRGVIEHLFGTQIDPPNYWFFSGPFSNGPKRGQKPWPICHVSDRAGPKQGILTPVLHTAVLPSISEILEVRSCRAKHREPRRFNALTQRRCQLSTEGVHTLFVGAEEHLVDYPGVSVFRSV